MEPNKYCKKAVAGEEPSPTTRVCFIVRFISILLLLLSFFTRPTGKKDAQRDRSTKHASRRHNPKTHPFRCRYWFNAILPSKRNRNREGERNGIDAHTQCCCAGKEPKSAHFRRRSPSKTAHKKTRPDSSIRNCFGVNLSFPESKSKFKRTIHRRIAYWESNLVSAQRSLFARSVCLARFY